MSETTYSIRYEVIDSDRLLTKVWGRRKLPMELIRRWAPIYEEEGALTPIEVVALCSGEYCVVGGRDRLEALRLAGVEEIPCVVLQGPYWEQDDLYKLVRIRVGILTSCCPPDELYYLYSEFKEKYGPYAVQDLFAFVDNNAKEEILHLVDLQLKRFGVSDRRREDVARRARGVAIMGEVSRIVSEVWADHARTASLSFLVFAAAEKDHVYVEMDFPLRSAVQRVLDYCEVEGKDAGDVLEPAIRALADMLEGKRCLAPGMSRQDVVF